MSYSIFLTLFLGLPLVTLGSFNYRHLCRSLLWTLLIISAVAVLYTGPWDNLIVTNGVWSYGPRHIFGVVIGRVPLEEYLFYVLQVFLTGFFTARVLTLYGREPAC